eukprot:406674-Amorphochlora_amoeboformis.AAC.1
MPREREEWGILSREYAYRGNMLTAGICLHTLASFTSRGNMLTRRIFKNILFFRVLSRFRYPGFRCGWSH